MCVSVCDVCECVCKCVNVCECVGVGGSGGECM